MHTNLSFGLLSLFFFFSCTHTCTHTHTHTHAHTYRLEVSQIKSQVTQARDQYHSMIEQGKLSTVSALPEFSVTHMYIAILKFVLFKSVTFIH